MEDKEHQKLFGEVWQYILDKKLYRNPKLNRQSLINEFGTNRQYLYEAISKNGEDNFRGLVNRFRISEAKEIIDEKTYKNLTIDFSEISEKIGFNSYPTFYRAFKTITGLTPNEYLRELKQDQKIRKQGALSSHFQINDQ
jgi:YesN/AraC family two-component response regulator